MLLANWIARIYDVKSAFLKEKFVDAKKLFMDMQERYGTPQLAFSNIEAT